MVPTIQLALDSGRRFLVIEQETSDNACLWIDR